MSQLTHADTARPAAENPMAAVDSSDVGLGYDPHPELDHWRGTPIPSVESPLPATEQLKRIVDRMWWNGPPWTILRNRSKFLCHAMDYTTPEDFLFLWKNIPERDWIAMLSQLKPGQASTRSYCLYGRLLGVLSSSRPLPPEWREARHIKDLLFKNRRPIRELRQSARERNGI
jgi:hypothetical protein